MSGLASGLVYWFVFTFVCLNLLGFGVVYCLLLYAAYRFCSLIFRVGLIANYE